MHCSCDVPMDVDDCGVFQFSKEKIACKNHKCSECGEIILRGTRYENLTYFDGKFVTYKTCLDCLSARKQFFNEGYYFTMIWELLEEHIREKLIYKFPWSCLKNITKKSRERICGFIEELWKEEEEEEDENKT